MNPMYLTSRLFLIVIVATLSVSIVPVMAQRVTLNRSVDYNVLEASSIHEHNGRMYLLYSNGQIAFANEETGLLQQQETPLDVIAHQLFTNDGLLWFRSTEGHLWYLNEQGVWVRLVGNTDCFFVSQNDELYSAYADSVFRYGRTSDGYQRSLLRVLPDIRRSYSLFVRNDTIVAHVLPVNSTTSTTVMSAHDSFRLDAFGNTGVMYVSQFVERSDGQIYAIDGQSVYEFPSPERMANSVYRISTSVRNPYFVTANKVQGQVILGITGSDINYAARTILLSESFEETLIEHNDSLLNTERTILATDAGPVILYKGNTLVVRRENMDVTVRSAYQQIQPKSMGLPFYRGIVNGQEYYMYAGVDSMFIVTSRGLSSLFLIPEEARQQFRTGETFVYIRDSQATIIVNDRIYTANTTTNEWALVRRPVKCPERKVLLRDSSMIAAGFRSLWISTPHGTSWRSVPIQLSFTIRDVIESSEALLLQYYNEVVVVRRADLTDADTITSNPYIPATVGDRLLLSLTDTVGTVITPYRRAADDDSIDVLSFVRVSPQGVLDSIDVRLTSPLPVSSGYAIAQRFEDTTVYFQPRTGILLYMVGGSVVRRTTVPPSILGPFPWLLRSHVLWEFHSTTSLTLTHRRVGLQLTIDFESSPVSSVEENVLMMQVNSVSPTPAQERITIQLSKLAAAQTSTATLHLVDVNGSMVKDLTPDLPRWTSGTFEVADIQVDVRHVSNGIYFLVLSNGQTSHLAKLIVQR